MRKTLQSPLARLPATAARTQSLPLAQLRRGVSTQSPVRPHPARPAHPARGCINATSPVGAPRICKRNSSSVSVAAAAAENVNHDDIGPIQEYDARVASGRLRNDEHQRVLLWWAFQRRPSEICHRRHLRYPPRGLYLYGDVGSGKTMLMDLFYDTLPSSIKTKTRIHFHHFMQDVHKRSHKLKQEHGIDIDTIPFIAADIAQQGSVLCFDEFQCTDVADAMILRRLLEALMSHGVVLVTTSNRHPDELYKNGVQRESFVPAINLLKSRLHVINLDSPTDYRKIPALHRKWFRFLGDPESPEPHPEVQTVWGRKIYIPRVSGTCAWFTFDELIRQPTSAADYLELMRSYGSFIITDVPGMTLKERDLARRFITFIDAVYERQAKLVLTTEKPLTELFVSRDELAESLKDENADNGESADSMINHFIEDLGHNVEQLKSSPLFTGEEEAFAFARALSRLKKDDWAKVRSRRMEDSM
ncbi:unnamed protein product [Parascedosporium putredinis]|uniref:AFG1-like ATPase n=1 Tax=Parascedosporium putredinis TaxID=1442378 RepID=A0A9P1M790_9PEZI|nr:unnamed protein product [Parascedosporium putredinis]CAI7987941.1 unnamed protein product [Parascedosporium putredinis]